MLKWVQHPNAYRFSGYVTSRLSVAELVKPELWPSLRFSYNSDDRPYRPDRNFANVI